MVLGLTGHVAAGPMYRAVVLEKEPGTYDIMAFDMNARGEVVGYASAPEQGRRPILWGADGKIKQIWNEEGLAKVISDDGRVYGHLGSYNGEQAVEFLQNGGFVPVSSVGANYHTVVALYGNQGVVARNPYAGFDLVYHDGTSVELSEWSYWGGSSSITVSGTYLTYVGC